MSSRSTLASSTGSGPGEDSSPSDPWMGVVAVGEEEEEVEEGGVHCQDTERLPQTFCTEQVKMMGSPSSKDELLERPVGGCLRAV